MSWILLIFLFLLVLVLYAVFKIRIQPKIHFKAIIQQFPGPKVNWVLGNNLLDIEEEHILSTITKWRREFEGSYVVWYETSVPTLIVCDPDLVKHLLQTEVDIKHYKKGYEQEFKPWLGNSILLCSGSVWTHKRKMMNPTFGRVDNHFSTFVENTNRLVERWNAEIDASPLHIIKEDLPSILKLLSLNIICECAVGFDLNLLGVQIETNTSNSNNSSSSKKREEDMKLLKMMDERSKANSIMDAFNNVLTLIEKRSYSLFPLPNWIWLNFTRDGRSFTPSVNYLRTWAHEMIRERKKNLKDKESDNKENDDDDNDNEHNVDPYLHKRKHRPDLLTLLIQTIDPSTGQELSEEEIGEDVMTFLFAGHETTSTAISWTIYLLCKHPEVMKKVRDEIDSILAEEEEITYRYVSRFEYLLRVVKESMRLYPPQPAFVRKAVKDHWMGCHFIPSGTEVSVVPYLIHRDERFWDHPEEFDPDRFLPERCGSRHRFAYLPFSGGKRACIGSSFALLEARVVLLMLLRSFDFELEHGCEPIPVPAVTLQPHNLKVLIHKRRK